RAAGDRAAAGGVRVIEDRVRHAGRRRSAARRRTGRAVSLANVPSVVGARCAEVDLLPNVLSHVVDVEARGRSVRIEGDAERIAQAPRVGLLAYRPGRGGAVVAARRAAARERVAGRDAAGGRDTEHLADECVAVARCVVRPGAAAAGIVATAVADGDVEVAVLAEREVAGVV